MLLDILNPLQLGGVCHSPVASTQSAMTAMICSAYAVLGLQSGFSQVGKYYPRKPGSPSPCNLGFLTHGPKSLFLATFLQRKLAQCPPILRLSVPSSSASRIRTHKVVLLTTCPCSASISATISASPPSLLLHRGPPRHQRSRKSRRFVVGKQAQGQLCGCWQGNPDDGPLDHDGGVRNGRCGCESCRSVVVVCHGLGAGCCRCYRHPAQDPESRGMATAQSELRVPGLGIEIVFQTPDLAASL